jgi:hypothetical protein
MLHQEFGVRRALRIYGTRLSVIFAKHRQMYDPVIELRACSTPECFLSAFVRPYREVARESAGSLSVIGDRTRRFVAIIGATWRVRLSAGDLADHHVIVPYITTRKTTIIEHDTNCFAELAGAGSAAGTVALFAMVSMLDELVLTL